MFKLIVFCIFLITAQSVNADDYDDYYEYDESLIDLETRLLNKLNVLQNVVLSYIYNSLIEVDNYVRELIFFRNNYLSQSKSAVRDENQLLKENFTTLKETAGQNVETCIANYETELEELTTTILSSLEECHNSAVQAIASLQNEAQYTLHIHMNHVDIFYFQIEVCAGDHSCLEPLEEQITNARFNIHKKIEEEVQRISELAADVTILIQECGDHEVEKYKSDSNTIYNSIVSCVQK